MILEIYQATIEDAMVVAEIMLYSCISAAGGRQACLSTDGTCTEMTAWKQEWVHILGMAT